MLNDKFSERFRQLHDKAEALPVARSERGNMYFERDAWYSWATDCQFLIKSIFGENSPYYENFVDEMKKCNNSFDSVQSLRSLFVSYKEAFEGGFVFNDVELSISGEVLGDFVALAKQALADNYKNVSAVLASAALEDSLKRYAKLNGLDVEDAEMKQVISALKSKRLVSGATKSMLDVMPKLRNYALHANWEKITEPDVSSMIGFVEQFLLKEFSP